MFSIIICSISPERAERVRRNVAETIGCPHEVIAIDNRQPGLPLAKVYNEGAARARFPLLAFVHEDVEFHTKGWGALLAAKLQEDGCGAIGFAGSRIMAATCSGWSQGDEFDAWHYRDHGRPARLNTEGDFTPVVTLDGFAICVRRSLALAHPFDEASLTGFHCYDVDFCLTLARTHRNYVCASVDVSHFSSGSYNRQWHDCTVRLYEQKWRRLLPMAAGLPLPTEADTERVASRFLYRTLRIGGLPLRAMARQWAGFCVDFCPSAAHLSHCLQHGLKLLRNALGAHR